MTADRVIVLSRDRGLATVAGSLVDHGQALARFVSPAELPDWLSQPVAAVVLDFPRRARGIVYRQLRQRYQGPVLALLEPGETSSGLPTDRGRVGVLHRPFQGEQLCSLLSTLAGVGAAFSPADPLPGLGHRSQGEAIAASIGATLAVPPPSARITSGTAVVGAGPATTTSTARGPRRRRGAARLQVGAVGKRRLTGLAVVLGASAALLVGIMLSGEPGCRAAGCGIASAIGAVGVPPTIGPGVAASPGAAPASGAGGTGSLGGTPAQTTAGPSTVTIASGVGDLLNGTSSSSGGAPPLVVGGGLPPSVPGGGSGGGAGGVPPAGGGSGGGVPPATTSPPGTTAPPGTAPPPTTAPPPPTDPPTTAPPPTDPPTTAPPPTDPPTTQPPPTEPPTTAAVTTPAVATPGT